MPSARVQGSSYSACVSMFCIAQRHPRDTAGMQVRCVLAMKARRCEAFCQIISAVHAYYSLSITVAGGKAAYVVNCKAAYVLVARQHLKSWGCAGGAAAQGCDCGQRAGGLIRSSGAVGSGAACLALHVWVIILACDKSSSMRCCQHPPHCRACHVPRACRPVCLSVMALRKPGSRAEQDRSFWQPWALT